MKSGKSSEPMFEIDLVGLNLDPCQYDGAFSVQPSKTYRDIDETHLIVIPGWVGNMRKQIEINTPFVDWIVEQRLRHGTEVASLCRGAFLLAETGLMQGKTCATHWLTHDLFKQMYPEVKLMPEKIICEDNGIYSSGGAYSYLNLIVHLIEKYFGRETALWCSKVAEVEFDRLDQNQFAIFLSQKDHGDQEISEVQDYIEANYEDKLSVNALADRLASSTRNFVRRFKKATNNTPIEYIQRVRIEAAKKKLETSAMNVQQVMYECGYNDDKTFRTIFKRYAGLTPNQYRLKYNREAAWAK